MNPQPRVLIGSGKPALLSGVSSGPYNLNLRCPGRGTRNPLTPVFGLIQESGMEMW